VTTLAQAPSTGTRRTPSSGAVGVAAGVGAYALWGLLTLYWAELREVG